MHIFRHARATSQRLARRKYTAAMSVSLPTRAPLVGGVAHRRPSPSLSQFFSSDRPFRGDTAARFLWCPTRLSGRGGVAPIAIWAQGAADGGSESERTIPAMGCGVGLRVVSFCERRRSCPSLHARAPLRTLLSVCSIFICSRC